MAGYVQSRPGFAAAPDPTPPRAVTIRGQWTRSGRVEGGKPQRGERERPKSIRGWGEGNGRRNDGKSERESQEGDGSGRRERERGRRAPQRGGEEEGVGRGGRRRGKRERKPLR